MSQSAIIHIQEAEGIVAHVFEPDKIRGKASYRVIVEVPKEKMAYEVRSFTKPDIGAFARVFGDGEVIIPNDEDDNADSFNYRDYLKSYSPKDKSKGWKYLVLNINDFNIIKDIEVFQLIRNVTQGMDYYHKWLLEPERFHNVKKYFAEISKDMTALQIKIQESLLTLDSNTKVSKTR